MLLGRYICIRRWRIWRGEAGDQELLKSCRRLWDNIASKQLYITEESGPLITERPSPFAYDLPNDTAYAETCASIGLIFFAHRMLQMDMDSRYGDVMERALYNVVLGPLPGWKAIFLCESFGGLARPAAAIRINST